MFIEVDTTQASFIMRDDRRGRIPSVIVHVTVSCLHCGSKETAEGHCDMTSPKGTVSSVGPRCIVDVAVKLATQCRGVRWCEKCGGDSRAPKADFEGLRDKLKSIVTIEWLEEGVAGLADPPDHYVHTLRYLLGRFVQEEVMASEPAKEVIASAMTIVRTEAEKAAGGMA